MTTVFDSIIDAHTADSFPVNMAYGRNVLKAEAISQVVRQSGVQRFLVSAPLPMGNDIRNSTHGDVKVVQPWMVIFAATERECVEALEAWFVRVGCTLSSGIVGKPPVGPWTYSTLSLLSYNPIGDLEQFAEPYGDVFAIEQYVRISIA
jgi:hypothetical protein